MVQHYLLLKTIQILWPLAVFQVGQAFWRARRYQAIGLVPKCLWCFFLTLKSPCLRLEGE